MLHIFPEASLASSLITTVWIGVFVVCFFNLRFGWNLSGLIVPGYMVPLLILKPWSAIAIVIEALFTYFLIWFFSEFCSRLGYWSSLFGRDRFFAIILFAVVSRVSFDCIIFPWLTLLLAKYANITFVYKGGLYSIGLVIVALIANQFWNPGIKRGFPQFAIVLFITFLIIRFLLIQYTNFRISEVAYLYEDIATSVAASPKVYIILIVTAFLASRMNLLYGWEFGGIVLPALLALQWYYPWKIVSSILEAGIIYGLAVLILKTPLFRSVTIEGARKILLFFNIAFAYKMLMGFLLPLVFSDVDVPDVYGLGYMLTSVIAIKMYDKKIGLRMTRITLQTSILAVFIATLIGFALLYLPVIGTANRPSIDNTIQSRPLKGSEISKIILNEQVRLYGISRPPERPDHAQLIQFNNALKAIKDYIRENSHISLQYASLQLNYLGYRLDIIDGKYILLYEGKKVNSRGLYIISVYPKNKTLLKVPLSIQSPALIDNAVYLLKKYRFAALAIAGGKKTLHAQMQASLSVNTLYKTFCKAFETNQSIQLFQLDNYLISLLKKDKKQLSPGHDYVFSPFSNEQLKEVPPLFSSFKKFAEQPDFVKGKNDIAVFLSPETTLKLLADSNTYDPKVPKYAHDENLYSLLTSKKGFLTSSISSILGIFKSKGKTKKSQPLPLSEAKFIDNQIITPIINMSDNYSQYSKQEIENKLKLVNFAAHIAGCSVLLETVDGISFVSLSMDNKNRDEYLGGTYLFKIGSFAPCTIEITNPDSKNNLILGFYLAKHLKARAVFISGTIESDNIISFDRDTITAKSLFNLVNQIVIRETDKPPAIKKDIKYNSTVIQICSLPKSHTSITKIPDMLFLSTYAGIYKETQLQETEKDAYQYLRNHNFTIQFVAGDKQTAGLEALNSMQARYIQQTKNTSFMIIWLTPDKKVNPDFINHFGGS